MMLVLYIKNHFVKLLLGMRIPYNASWYDKLCSYTSFHKLTYRLNRKALCHGTYYDVLINGNSNE